MDYRNSFSKRNCRSISVPFEISFDDVCLLVRVFLKFQLVFHRRYSTNK